MVRAAGVVLVELAPELRHDHDDDLGRQRRVERVVERLDAVVEPAEVLVVRLQLVGVRVPAAVVVQVHDAHADPGVDQARRHHHLATEPRVGERAVVGRGHRGAQVHQLLRGGRVEIGPRAEPGGGGGHRPDGVVQLALTRPRVGAEEVAVARQRHRPGRPSRHVVRHVVRHARDRHRTGRGAQRVEPAAQPAGVGAPGTAPALLPDAHRLEVAAVEVRVADALHDGQVLGVPLLLQVGEPRVEREPAAQAQRGGGGERDRGAQAVVLALAGGHDHVEPVVPAVQVHEQQDPVAPRRGGAGERVAVREVGGQGDAAARQRGGLQEPPARQAGGRVAGLAQRVHGLGDVGIGVAHGGPLGV